MIEMQSAAGGALHAMAACVPAAALTAGASVDHIGIAVPDLAAAVPFYQSMLGRAPERVVELPAQGIAVAMFELAELRVELLAPIGVESPITDVLEGHTIQAFLARQPEGGLHHICFLVPDLATACPPGVRVLGTGKPIMGAHGLPIVFLDPAGTGGVLLELKQSG